VHLYETHLPVRNTENSIKFYRDVVGLEFASRALDRDIAFLWIGEGKRSMLGLWGPGTAYGESLNKHHLAIALSLEELLSIGAKLNSFGVVTRNFNRENTTEPSVIGWMPSAQLYFDDPDGHVLEYIALLDGTPDANFIGSLSRWQQEQGISRSQTQNASIDGPQNCRRDLGR
jgi:lactoylglutathione lyase